MGQETTNQPEPRPTPVILRAKPLRVEANFRMSARLVSAPKPSEPPEPPEPPEKPPFIDRNLKAGKFVLKGLRKLGRIGAIIGGLEKILELFGLKRQPAVAAQL